MEIRGLRKKDQDDSKDSDDPGSGDIEDDSEEYLPRSELDLNNHLPQYPIYLVPDIQNMSLGLVPRSYFECLGPDNHLFQYLIYLVPDIGNGSLGLVPLFQY